MADCIFCQIVAGDAPGYRLYEDDRILVFLDLFPVTPGHTLIIPKAHAENLFETPPDDLSAVIRYSRTVAHAIKRALDPAGIGVIQLNGAAAGQTVFHYHMHLIPRNPGDGLPRGGGHGRIQGDPDELSAMAERLRAALAAD